MEKEQTKQFNEFERRFKIPLTLENFKLISKRNYDNGHFKKLGHARESFAKELGFDCYRAYTKKFHSYWNKLSKNVFNLIEEHKKLKNPIPLLIIVNTDKDYIQMLKKEYEIDFNYFNEFSKNELFLNGRSFSKINIFDIFTEIEFERDLDEVIKVNSNITHLDENGEFSLLEYERIINRAINFAYEIGDKDECTDKHIAYVLSALYLGGSPLQAIDYDTPNPNLEFDSKKMIKLYKLWDEVEEIMPKISKSIFKEIVSKNEYAYYFDNYTINKTQDLIDKDVVSDKTDSKERVLNTILEFTRKVGSSKKVKVNIKDLMPEKQVPVHEIFKSLNELKEKGLIDSFNCTENSITTRINSKFKDLIIKE
jgi:hypothetical protein